MVELVGQGVEQMVQTNRGGHALRVLVVGGGAAGFFAAITCAEAYPGARVLLYEATAQPLSKVRISGGGRCNVTHACPEPRELVQRYPRGGRELLGPFTRFGPRETVAWFAARGVELKTETDGRMFPVSDDSATIVECLLAAAAAAGVKVFTRMAVRSVTRRLAAAGGPDQGEVNREARSRDDFEVMFADGSVAEFDRVLLATGGGRGSIGLKVVEDLGHSVVPPVPSLFTLHIDDVRIRGLEGLSVPEAVARVPELRLSQTGALLVTHWGMSGPAILKLSAWGARLLAERDYRVNLHVSWVGERTPAETLATLLAARTANPRKQVSTWNPFSLPARLWERLVVAAGLTPETMWAQAGNAKLLALAEELADGRFTVEGKSLNKDEFVTCGGVSLREVDFKSMGSRLCPGLFFAGEVLDVDGVTGGFNFQAAWTTGWLAGKALGLPREG